MKIEITLKGCDDSTTILAQCTTQEFLFLAGLAGEFERESTSACMPTMEIREIKE